jgi:uncharacterized protein YaiE (UPF0345 family)
MFKTNEYFDGKVKSLAFETKDGPATLGVMAPGTYEFGTSTPEEMTVITGTLVIRQPGAPDRRLPKAEVARTQFIRRSLMPEGLLDALPEKAAADLLAYLLTLKG